MADVLTGRTYVARGRRADRERLTQRVLVVVIVVLSLILVGELVYHLLVAPRLAIDTITIDGDVPLSDAEILSIAGVYEGVRFFAVDPDTVASLLEQHPVIREAQVQTVFPNRLSISVVRRLPLAAALALTEAGTVPLVFDEDGVVFQTGAEAQTAALPVVSGLRFALVEPGLQLPPMVVDFLRQLRRIRMNDPALYGLFSEYRIVQRNEFAYEVVLYPMHYQLPVRIGTSIDAEMIQYVMMMLDVLHREGRISQFAELDFRSGEGVLRPRDERSGGESARGGAR